MSKDIARLGFEPGRLIQIRVNTIFKANSTGYYVLNSFLAKPIFNFTTRAYRSPALVGDHLFTYVHFSYDIGLFK